MKKSFALFLVCTLLFLTGCNTQPSLDTNADDSSQGGNESNPVNWEEALKDQIVLNKPNATTLIDLPSRIVFEDYLSEINQTYTCYYSKADDKVYIYCFDPLCSHDKEECLAKPGVYLEDWEFSSTYFINGRFYYTTGYGRIYSFSFDGSDKKLEYDAGYDLEAMMGNQGYYTNVWSVPSLVYGPYIYIVSKAEENGNPHTLRFHIETKEMEDLTEKTGNFISPLFFYNGMIYGFGKDRADVVTDLDLNTAKTADVPLYIRHSVGNLLIGEKYSEELVDQYGLPLVLGIEIYDMKTKESRVISCETLGMNNFVIASVTDEYIYFYRSEIYNLGTVIMDMGGKDKEVKVQKMNDGKLYRMNLDGTNLVCVYDNFDYELNRNVIIYEDRVVMQGQYIKIEDGKKKVWGGPIQVATINPDGTFGEFAEVEVLQ